MTGDIIGYIAAFCTTISFLPQVIRIWQTKNTSAISLGMYLIFVIGIALWLVYGLIIWNIPMIVANAVTLLLAGTVLVLKLKLR